MCLLSQRNAQLLCLFKSFLNSSYYHLLYWYESEFELVTVNSKLIAMLSAAGPIGKKHLVCNSATVQEFPNWVAAIQEHCFKFNLR